MSQQGQKLKTIVMDPIWNLCHVKYICYNYTMISSTLKSNLVPRVLMISSSECCRNAALRHAAGTTWMWAIDIIAHPNFIIISHQIQCPLLETDFARYTWGTFPLYVPLLQQAIVIFQILSFCLCTNVFHADKRILYHFHAYTSNYTRNIQQKSSILQFSNDQLKKLQITHPWSLNCGKLLSRYWIQDSVCTLLERNSTALPGGGYMTSAQLLASVQSIGLKSLEIHIQICTWNIQISKDIFFLCCSQQNSM